MKIQSKISSFVGVILLVGLLGFAAPAQAVTPTLMLAATGDGDAVQVTVTGDANASVILYYTKTNVGSSVTSIGTTNASGSFSTTLSSNTYGIAATSAVSVTVGGLSGSRSAAVTWPATGTNGGNLALSPTNLVLSVGQSSSMTVQNNSSNTVYLSNNSNPPIANANISGNQISVAALSNGSTVMTFCAQGSTTSCISAYVTVQSTSAQALSFSMNNVKVAQGQSLPIAISGGNGVYQVLNNSNSSAVQANISGSTVTLTTSGTSNANTASAITVCTSDMVTCGIINAAVGSSTTTPLTFNVANPSLSVGQSLSIVISGGSISNPTFTIASNSNMSAVTAAISGNVLNLFGNNNGTANITVCSSAGSCGTLTATVNYASSGGTLQLSQSSVSVLVGQVVSVTVTGGTSPYTISGNNGTYFQSSLNGNILTISGISAGSSTLNVCSALGACVSLMVTVNASGAGTPITFSQNNVSLAVGGVTAITISGSGGYYASTASNQAVASVQISGSTALVTALASGSTNVSICQSGGQCSILFVTVSNSQTTSLPLFSQTNPSMSVGQTLQETISGGSGSSYYILANTNPIAVQLSLANSQLTLSALSSGVATVVVCASSNSCATLSVNVNSTTTKQSIGISQLSPSLTVGQTLTETITGNGNYYLASNSNTTIASIQISGSTGVITAIAPGSTTLSICQAATECVTVVVMVTAAQVPASPAPSTGTYASGQLIKEDNTVYIVYKNTKVAFANAPAFLGLGYKFSNVLSVTGSGLDRSTKIVITAIGHPRGSWLLSGKTVYFLTPEGLIPVPNRETFLNNGGQESFIVKATSYDMTLAKLPAMTASDSRIK